MEDEPKKFSKTNMAKICVFFLVVICMAFVLARYLINDEFRNLVDTKILGKEVTENNSNVIEINSDDNPTIYAYHKYITVLSKNVLTFYNQEASMVSQIDVNVTTPYVTSNEKYLAVAENGGSKLYLIADTGIKWEKEVDGSIYRVSVSKNGYVSVLLKNATYKSIVAVYDADGTELFKSFLAKSYAVCSEISDNHKYLAIGQIDYSGTIVKSIVNLISIDMAREKPKEATLYTYESEASKILSNIKFNSKNEAICMFDSYIQKVTVLSDEKLYDISSNNIFVDINLANDVVIVEKETSGLFSYQYQMNIKNTVGKSDNLYILDNDVPKRLKVTKNVICMNLANEVRMVNANGWLLKRYTTRSEIQDIVVGDSIIGIIYNNKIEVIDI